MGISRTSDGQGYWLVATDGGIFTFGDAQFYGSTGARTLNKPIVGMAATPDDHGYWLVATDGGIFTFGDAQFYGSTGALTLNKPMVGMAATPDGRGYWLVAADGGIFTFGDAQFYGSTGALTLNKPIVGMAATPGGRGYWLVAADGGIFTFGDAKFYGSTGALTLNKPMVGMASTPDGRGYWLVAADGGIFTGGDAQFHGSSASAPPGSPTAAISSDSSSLGYWTVTDNGQVSDFGAAPSLGSPATPTTDISGSASTACLPDPAATIAALPRDGTFNGTGHCYTTLGIQIREPGVTVEGGTYNDPTTETTGPVNTSVNPIISVQAPNVTVKDATLNGLDTDGVYANTDVGEEGIQVVSGGGTQDGVATTGVVLDNITTNFTFGDGFILGFEPRQPPPSVSVNNYTINWAGRQGLTLAYGSGTFNNVTVNQPPIARVGVDFESDIDNFGPSDIVFNHLTTNQGVLIQSLEGPATFTNSTLSDNIGLIGDAASSGSQVTLDGGSLAIRNDWHGTPPAGIWVDGAGNLDFDNVDIYRLPGSLPTTQAWLAVNGAHVTFKHSLGAIAPPLGTNDANSTVTVVP